MSESDQDTRALQQRCEILSQLVLLSHGADHPLFLQIEEARRSGSVALMRRAIEAHEGVRPIDSGDDIDPARYGETD